MNPQFTKTMVTKFESVDDKGTIVAKSSSYSNVDVYGDSFQRGAFDSDIARISKSNKIPMLFNHSPDEVIGSWHKMWDDDQFVYTEGKLALGIQRADDVRIMLKDEHISGVSIGFNAKEASEIKNADGQHTGMLFKSVHTLESSVVVFPANPMASVSEVKSQTRQREFEKFLVDAARDAGLSLSRRDVETLSRSVWPKLAIKQVERDADEATDISEAQLMEAISAYRLNLT